MCSHSGQKQQTVKIHRDYLLLTNIKQKCLYFLEKQYSSMRTATEGKPKHHNTVITAPETRKHIALKKKRNEWKTTVWIQDSQSIANWSITPFSNIIVMTVILTNVSQAKSYITSASASCALVSFWSLWLSNSYFCNLAHLHRAYRLVSFPLQSLLPCAGSLHFHEDSS